MKKRPNTIERQNLQDILRGRKPRHPIMPSDDFWSDLPLPQGRFSHIYPLFLHQHAKRMRVGVSPTAPVSSQAQARLTSALPVVQDALEENVVRGLDFLKVSFWVRWNPIMDSFLAILDSMKKRVQETEQESIPVFQESGFDWNLFRTGTKLYTFRIKSGDITLMFNRRKENGQIPNCRLEIGSLSCWSPGFYAIYERVKAFLAINGGEVIKERVSEAHLAADFVGTDIKTTSLDQRDHWIALARNDGDYDGIRVRKDINEPEPDELAFDRHYTNRRFSGLNIGSGDMMLRVYDKVTELKRSRATHKQQIFAEAWKLNSYDEQPVTRVEYQIRRPRLREFSDREGHPINTVKDLCNALKSLWHYLTTEWTRHAGSTVNRNHNQTKSKISEFWQKVQAVVWTGVFGYVRTHPVKHRDIEMLRQQARGCLMSVCASLEVEPDDIDKIVHLCKGLIEEDLHAFFKNQKAFIDRMTTRRNEYRATLAG